MANENAVAARPKHEMAVINAKPMFLQIEQGDESRWNKELVFAMQTVRGSKALQECTGDSIMNSIVNIATIGISLNPALALAYLVPRGGKCVLDISYRGLTRIATDSGSVLDIDACVVYEQDYFEYEMGLTPRLVHRPSISPDKGKPVCVYAVAVLHNGMKKFIVLDRQEVEKVKATSKARSGPWVEWETEMWRKTAVKKLTKLLPQSDRMAEAVAILNEHEGLEVERNNSKKIFDHIETLERAEEASFEKTDLPAGEDALQEVYKKLTDYAGERGETPDDLISRFTKGKVPALIDLEGKPVNYLNDITLMVDTERDSK